MRQGAKRSTRTRSGGRGAVLGSSAPRRRSRPAAAAVIVEDATEETGGGREEKEQKRGRGSRASVQCGVSSKREKDARVQSDERRQIVSTQADKEEEKQQQQKPETRHSHKEAKGEPKEREHAKASTLFFLSLYCPTTLTN